MPRSPSDGFPREPGGLFIKLARAAVLGDAHVVGRRVPLWVPLVGALGIFLFAKRAFAWRGGKPKIPDTPENREYLTRILLVEAGDTLDRDEWAAIAYVAVNRAERWYATAERKIRQGKELSLWAREHYPNRGVKAVVDAVGWFGSDEPRGRLNSPELLGHTLAGRMRSFADDVFDGRIKNPIGPRTMFVHPSGMKACGAEGVSKTSSGETRVCRSTAFGLRWIPDWAISSTEGGRAENEPVEEGRAVFAGHAVVLGYYPRVGWKGIL